MSYEQKISSETAAMIVGGRPTFGTGFAGKRGLVAADTGTRWFTQTALVEVIGSADDRH